MGWFTSKSKPASPPEKNGAIVSTEIENRLRARRAFEADKAKRLWQAVASSRNNSLPLGVSPDDLEDMLDLLMFYETYSGIGESNVARVFEGLYQTGVWQQLTMDESDDGIIVQKASTADIEAIERSIQSNQ